MANIWNSDGTIKDPTFEAVWGREINREWNKCMKDVRKFRERLEATVKENETLNKKTDNK